MKYGVKLIVMGLLTIFGLKANASVEVDFWKWFEKNGDMIFNFENDTENTFDKLAVALSKVDPNLAFEFSPIHENGKREFVISAGGITETFPSVELLFNSAPELKQWVIVKFRPRRTHLNDITFGGISVKSDDVYYNLYQDEDKLGVILFLDHYTKDEHTTYASLGYLFLDESLGEYDVETKLGFIEFHNKNSEQFAGAKPLKELAKQVDKYYSN